mgnify:CR=1 FL=1
MKQYLLLLKIFVLSTFTTGVFAQIVIDDSIFPEVGDTVMTLTDPLYTDFDVNASGENQVWNLMNVNGNFYAETIFADPMEGSESDMFPDADLLDNSGIQEIYYETQDDRIIELGRSGLDPVLQVIDLTYQNTGELVLRRAPMMYEDEFLSVSEFSVAAPSEVLPDSIEQTIGSFVDSLRLRVVNQYIDIVDGWGTLQMPDGDYEVLRIRRENTLDAKLDLFAPFFGGWQEVDPDSPLLAGIGDEFLGLLGEQTTTSFEFYTNGIKQPLATVRTDTMGNALGVTYRGFVDTATDPVVLNDGAVMTYPNPSYGNVTFSLVNLPPDNYKVVVYNIVGKEMWSEKISPVNKTLTANLSHLQKGTYLYSIVNGNGRKLTTKRLILVRP